MTTGEVATDATGRPAVGSDDFIGDPSSWEWKKYPLVMTNSSPWYRWPIEIDGLPFLIDLNSMAIFHGYVSHNQMVSNEYDHHFPYSYDHYGNHNQ